MDDLNLKLEPDLRALCQRVGIKFNSPSMTGSAVEIRLEPEGADAFRVTLLSGAYSLRNKELATQADGELVRLLTKPPYKLRDQERGIAFGNSYIVQRAE